MRHRHRASPRFPHGLALKLAMRHQKRLGMLLDHGAVCVYCGDARNKVTQDHAQPVSRGGRDLPENILPACQRCNQRKGAQSVAKFARSCPPNAPIHEILQRHRQWWA